MKSFFLDTGYLIALESADDQYHTLALSHWEEFIVTLPKLITTSYIFDETVTFFNSRHQQAKAVEIGTRLLSSPSIELVFVDETLFYEGWEYFQKHADKSYSLTDCISFMVMTKEGITEALTFDRHFVQAGFTKLP